MHPSEISDSSWTYAGDHREPRQASVYSKVPGARAASAVRTRMLVHDICWVAIKTWCDSTFNVLLLKEPDQGRQVLIQQECSLWDCCKSWLRNCCSGRNFYSMIFAATCHAIRFAAGFWLLSVRQGRSIHTQVALPCDGTDDQNDVLGPVFAISVCGDRTRGYDNCADHPHGVVCCDLAKREPPP